MAKMNPWQPQSQADQLCSDCPPINYPTDKTRCLPCPRRTQAQAEPVAEPTTQDFIRPFDGKIDIAAFHDARELWRAGKPWQPLYTHPAPREAVPDGCKLVPIPCGDGQNRVRVTPDDAKVNSMEKVFKFSLGQTIKLSISEEEGFVRARAVRYFSENQYLINYRAADGCCVEQWWGESQLESVE